jgi:hypothetical protein
MSWRLIHTVLNEAKAVIMLRHSEVKFTWSGSNTMEIVEHRVGIWLEDPYSQKISISKLSSRRRL